MKTVKKFFALFILVCLSGCSMFDIKQEDELSPYYRDSISVLSEQLRQHGKYHRERSEFAEALDAQTQAVDLSLELQDTMNIISDYNQLGTTFRRIGRLEQALNCHYKALNYVEGCNNKDSATWLKNYVITLNGLGNLHLTLGNDEMAETYFRKALVGEYDLDSKIGIAINYANLGSILQHRNELDSARYYYSNSMEYNKLANSDLGVALCHVHLGSILEAKDSLIEAEQEYRLAAHIMNEDGDKWHSLEALIALARNLRKQNRLAEADYYVDKSMTIAQEVHSYESLRDAAYQKAEQMEMKGDYKAALENYKESRAWNDSLTSSSMHFGDLCIAYEQQRTQRDLKELEKAYQANDLMHKFIFWIELALLVISLIALHLLWYAAKSRKTRIEALKNLDNMKDTFFRNITHEFRTPLTVITGLAEQLKDNNIETTQRVHFLSSIKQQGNKLLDLVNELLSLSKLMAGNSSYKWAHGDVVAFIGMTIANYKDFAKTRNVQLIFNSPQSKIEMDFVPEFYEKIIANLVGNAFKYTPSGGSITVKAGLRDSHLVLDVIDTGIGISVEDLPHIFELFYHGRESKMQGSSGIGLPFVKQMIRQMGGIISAKNNEPKGTIIEAILSTKCNEENAHIAPWSISDDYEHMGSDSKNIMTEEQTNEEMDADSANPANAGEELPHILIVEDNPDVGEYVSLLLRSKYKVTTACDGYDALNKVKQQLPDLVITDLMMPGMDGFEFCQILRKSTLFSDLPIIIISAHSAEKNSPNAADAYLVKPFNPKELEALIVHFLERRKQQSDKVQLLLSASSYSSQNEAEQLFLKQLKDTALKQIQVGDYRIEVIAQKMNSSYSQLKQKIEDQIGILPATYLIHVRLYHAIELMKDQTTSLESIAMDCGFDDYLKFTRIFKQHFHLSPTQFRETLIR